MYEATLIAATGLKNQQRRLDVIASNIANVNTVAYKGARLDFKDALYTAGIVPGPARTPAGNQQKGHGLMVAGIAKDYKPGSFIRTDRDLDLAIEGEGFFAVQMADGSTAYTRNGSFQLSIEADGAYIADNDGRYLLDIDGQRIILPENTESISVTEQGELIFTVGEETATAAPGIYTFTNITGLLTAGDGNYTESAASGARTAAENAMLRQGGLESSNVSLAEEMTRVIRTQRAFSLVARALTTADEMEGIANSMKA